MENQRYDVILFDADRTLFDFDRSQLDALREVFQTHGIPATQEMMDLYIRINNHLWGQFDRGEITTEELTRVRFRLFLEEAGDQGQDPAAMNRQYLESLGSHSYLLDGGGSAVPGAGPLLQAVHRHQRHQGGPGGPAEHLSHPALY